MSDAAIAYSTYRYSEEHKSRSLKVSDFYQEDIYDGFFVEFGYPYENARKSFRNLNSADKQVLIANLNMGLDSITLRDDMTALQVLKQFAE